MPGGLVLQNLNGLRFVKGFLFATPYASDGVTPHTADALSHGALQDISIEHSYGLVKLMGPESLAPLGVGISEETLTFAAKQGVVGTEHFATYIGGNESFSAGVTTYTKNVNDEPQKCDIHLKTPSDGSDMEVLLFGCVIEKCAIISNVANRGFHIGDISGQCYGQGAQASSKLFQVLMAGNHTLSS